MFRKYVLYILLSLSFGYVVYGLLCELDNLHLADIRIYQSIFLFLCFLWLCSGHYMVLTPRYINKSLESPSSGLLNTPLEYKFIDGVNGDVDRIYVYSYLFVFWHELDYELCIPRGSSHARYDEFTKKYNTLGLLLERMEHSLRRDKIKGYVHNNNRTMSICYSVCSLLLYFVSLSIIWS